MSSTAASKNKKALIILAVALLLVGFILIFSDSVIIGWHTADSGKYYITFPFNRASGVTDIGKSTYIFKDYGENEMLTGWQKIDGFYYYAMPDGKVAKGETVIDGEKWCFDKNSGKLYGSGIHIISGKLWCFDEHGFKVEGIHEIDGEKYFFSKKGNLETGLIEVDGKIYYFDEVAENMCHGLTVVDGDTYYFDTDGAAVTDEYREISGITYYFGSDGRKM